MPVQVYFLLFSPHHAFFFLLNWEKVFDNEFHASASPPTRMASVAPHLNTTADEMSWNIHLQSYSPLVCSEDLVLYTFWRVFFLSNVSQIRSMFISILGLKFTPLNSYYDICRLTHTFFT